MSAGEVLAFQRFLDHLLAETYRWELWGAAVLINMGGCSDDGFEYFRGWLISQGEEIYEAARDDPDSLSAFPQVTDLRTRPDALWCQDILYVAFRPYRELTGEDLPAMVEKPPALDTAWSLDDPTEMRRRYPRLWNRFGQFMHADGTAGEPENPSASSATDD